jgi:hypothetical protein
VDGGVGAVLGGHVGVVVGEDGNEGVEERVVQLEGEEQQREVVAAEEVVVVLVLVLVLVEEQDVGPWEEHQQNDHSYHYPS